MSSPVSSRQFPQRGAELTRYPLLQKDGCSQVSKKEFYFCDSIIDGSDLITALRANVIHGNGLPAGVLGYTGAVTNVSPQRAQSGSSSTPLARLHADMYRPLPSGALPDSWLKRADGVRYAATMN
jgi:hypothetical protein